MSGCRCGRYEPCEPSVFMVDSPNLGNITAGPWESIYQMRSFQKAVYCAARDGKLRKLVELLSKISQPWIIYEVLQYTIKDLTHCVTPFIAAVINGHEDTVKFLLQLADIQQRNRGCFWYGCYPTNRASPLLFAVGEGQYEMVKLLIRYGADIKHPEVPADDPPRISFLDGCMYLNPSTMLLEKYANICLCVIVASNAGNEKMLLHLLEHAPVHECAMNCGGAAMHAAAEGEHLDVINILIDHGVGFDKNANGMTPLQSAADARVEYIVECLQSHPDITRTEKIEAYELLGASFAYGHPPYDFEKAYFYLHLAMEDRFRVPDEIIAKPEGIVIPAYENRVECTNLQELELIEDDTVAIQMESMAIAERILGHQNQLNPEKLFFTGVMIETNSDTCHERCIRLWMHSMKLTEAVNGPLFRYLDSFTQMFGYLLMKKHPAPFSVTKEVFEYGTLELSKIYENPAECQTVLGIATVIDALFDSCLYIASIMLELRRTPDETKELHQCMYNFLQLDPVQNNGQTPLHSAVSFNSKMRDENLTYFKLFPNPELCRLLIKCGARIDARDNQGNTPLHVCGRFPEITYTRMHQCLITLIDNGAHMDFRNKRGQTAKDMALSVSTKAFLGEYWVRKHKLKCLAAKVVRKFNIPYTNVVPDDLKCFADLH